MESFKFNVAQLLKQPIGATRSYDVNEDVSALFRPEDDIELDSPLRGEIKFIRTVDGVLVTGQLETTAKLACRRCAAEFSTPVHMELEEEFRAAYDVYTGLKLPDTGEAEEATLIDEHHMLDLSEVIRQNLLLALPPFPLCREECAGLCATCGKDLNEGPCTCPTEEADSRWEALQGLLDQGA